jgi:hypothetical protein
LSKKQGEFIERKEHQMDFLTTDILMTIGSILAIQFIITAIFLVLIVISYFGAAKVRDWQPASGRILSSTVVRRRSSRGGTSSYPAIVYEYSVGGMNYQGQKITSGLSWGGSGSGKIVARYPAGSAVTVYYDPNNPADAVLERSVNTIVTWLAVILILTNACMCGFGAAIIFVL